MDWLLCPPSEKQWAARTACRSSSPRRRAVPSSFSRRRRDRPLRHAIARSLAERGGSGLTPPRRVEHLVRDQVSASSSKHCSGAGRWKSSFRSSSNYSIHHPCRSHLQSRSPKAEPVRRHCGCSHRRCSTAQRPACFSASRSFVFLCEDRSAGYLAMLEAFIFIHFPPAFLHCFFVPASEISDPSAPTQWRLAFANAAGEAARASAAIRANFIQFLLGRMCLLAILRPDCGVWQVLRLARTGGGPLAWVERL